MTCGRATGDRGQVGGVEVLALGLLCFVSGSLVFATAWAHVDARFAVARAAREGVRAYVEAPDAATAGHHAVTRARTVLDAHGRPGAPGTIGPPMLDRPFGRCVRVRLTVEYQIPVVVIPVVGGFGELAPASATHSELVDPFRTGLPGPSTC